MPTPTIPLMELWLKPGVEVIDSTDKRQCLIVGVNDSVHLTYGASRRKYSLEQALQVLTPVPPIYPSWVTVGASIKLKATGHAVVVLDVDAFTRRVTVKGSNGSRSVLPAAELDNWCPCDDRIELVKRLKPTWLRGGLFVKLTDTDKSFFVRSVDDLAGECSLQSVVWCTREGDGKRVPQTSPDWEYVPFDHLSRYEVLDIEGLPKVDVKCPACGLGGSLFGQSTVDKTYRGTCMHEWVISSSGVEVRPFVLTRYEIDIDV